MPDAGVSDVHTFSRAIGGIDGVGDAEGVGVGPAASCGRPHTHAPITATTSTSTANATHHTRVPEGEASRAGLMRPTLGERTDSARDPRPRRAQSTESVAGSAQESRLAARRVPHTLGDPTYFGLYPKSKGTV